MENNRKPNLQDCPCNRHSLLLPTRQFETPLANLLVIIRCLLHIQSLTHLCIVTFGPVKYRIMQLRKIGCFYHILFLC